MSNAYRIISLLIAVVLISGCGSAENDGVIIHIKSGLEDPHSVLMALSMAEKMSTDHDVLVYFDIHGIDVVLKNAPEISYKHFPAAAEQIDTLSERGVILLACPGCLQAAGKTEADLRQGIIIASKEAFFSFTNGRIITLDY